MKHILWITALILLGNVTYLPAQEGEPFIVREHHSDGNIRLEATVLNGKLHGPATVYYPDGTKKLELSYSHGELSEVIAGYDKDGKKMNGWIVDYYENGNPRFESEFIDGKPHGKGVQYNPDGSVRRKFVNDRGRIVHVEHVDIQDGELY